MNIGCVCLFAPVINVAVNIRVQELNLLSVLLGTYLGVELLAHVIILYLTF